MATVGIIASPSAGKDVRRLVANAGSVGDVDKIALIRRAAVGAIEGGADRLVVLDDKRHLIRRALEEALPAGVEVEVLDLEPMGTGRDSQRAAASLADVGAGAVLSFGGDGTCRDVAKGWLRAPLVPLAVGTNNVFPLHIEATLGGLAAGLVASGRLSLDDVAVPAKVIHVEVDGGPDDLALVDVVLVAGDFVGSRAVWHVEDVVAAVFAIADPASIGLSAIGASSVPTTRDDDRGVFVRTGPGGSEVRAAIAPGTFADVSLEVAEALSLGETVVFSGPGVLAFDGERDHVLGHGDTVRLTVRRDGPLVIDPVLATRLAANGKIHPIEGA
ncbi:MAG: diacylglycerol kinase family protein [Actinomycetota bacterium]